jgi:hypothetical protein
MSYTNLETVRKHINLDEIPGGEKSDYPVTFVDLEWVNLPGRGIVDNSVVVKAIKNYAPISETITLGDGVVSLSNSRLVANSLTVASDSSLGAIYKENIDFSVDNAEGTIIRLIDGEIISGSAVIVWYYYYSIYSEGIDYSINYQSGMIRRLPGGNIQPKQTVLVDYELTYNQLNDEYISEAVDEANAIIEKLIDPGRQFGADLTLQTAATCLAVSIVCRMAAISDLRFGDSGKQTASAWLSLAESYRDDYKDLLKAFRPQASGLSGPKLT